jgi:hypothetical protein
LLDLTREGMIGGLVQTFPSAETYYHSDTKWDCFLERLPSKRYAQHSKDGFDCEQG